MMLIPFTKMVGAGNDFIVLDTVHDQLGALKTEWARVSRQLCNRHHGIGADGTLVLERSNVGHVKMRIFNPDGSEAEMCGNGARCVAHFVQAWPGHSNDTIVIETVGGIVSAKVHEKGVQMQMPEPRDVRFDLQFQIDPWAFRAAFLTVGVPHLVVPVKDLDLIDVNRVGKALRAHPTFLPHGTNVNFTQVDSRDAGRIRVRTYERGVEAETLACGTGAAASAIVHGLVEPDLRTSKIQPRQRREQQVCRLEIETRSGDTLTVSFTVIIDGSGGRVTAVTLQGPAHVAFEGTFPWQPAEER